MTKTPDIYISISNFFSDEYIASVDNDLRTDKLELVVQTTKQEQGFASPEWVIPSLIGVYILKSYFDGFLKEAGKHHFSLLKNWLTTNTEILKPITTKTVVAVGSDNKIDPTNTQSKTFSIHTIILDGVTLKFLFDDNLSIEQWQTASISALVLLEDYFENKNKNKLSIMLTSAKPQGKMLFAVINPETLTWELKPL